MSVRDAAILELDRRAIVDEKVRVPCCLMKTKLVRSPTWLGTIIMKDRAYVSFWHIDRLFLAEVGTPIIASLGFTSSVCTPPTFQFGSEAAGLNCPLLNQRQGESGE